MILKPSQLLKKALFSSSDGSPEDLTRADQVWEKRTFCCTQSKPVVCDMLDELGPIYYQWDILNRIQLFNTE